MSVINVVLAGLAADPHNVQLAEVACCAIKNAALGDDANRVKAAEAGAIEALLGAMRTHTHSPPVQARARTSQANHFAGSGATCPRGEIVR